MSKKKYVLIGVILLAALGLMISPLIRGWKSNEYLKEYVNSQYTGIPLDQSASYNMKSSHYETSITINGNSYPLSYIEGAIYDTYLEELLREQIYLDVQKIQDQLPDKIWLKGDLPIELADLAVDASDYEKTSWRLKFRYVYNDEKISKEESKKNAALLTEKVLAEMDPDLLIDRAQVIYYDSNGGYAIELDTPKFTELTYESLLSGTRKLDLKEISQEVRTWMETVH